MIAEDRYDSLICWCAAFYGRDPKAIKRQIRRESAFKPAAQSPVGAQGLMQFMPATWSEYGGTESPTNPEAAIKAGCRYMRDLEGQFGSLDKALAAYNWGPGNVRKFGTAPDWLAQCPQETQDYVAFCMQYAIESLGNLG